jgi:hypothetical protein
MPRKLYLATGKLDKFDFLFEKGSDYSKAENVGEAELVVVDLVDLGATRDWFRQCAQLVRPLILTELGGDADPVIKATLGQFYPIEIELTVAKDKGSVKQWIALQVVNIAASATATQLALGKMKEEVAR